MAKYVLAITKDAEKLFRRSEEVLVVGYNSKIRPEVSGVIKDLKETLHANPNLVALAAPQLGHFDRIFCIKFENGDIRTFINPMISKTEGVHLVREISPSLPGRDFIVPRHDKIIAIYQTPQGTPEENRFEGVVSEVFQHMVNMLDGVLISDIGLEVFEDFDKASDEDKIKIINLFLESVKAKTQELNEEIESNEDLKKTKDAIEFMKAVAIGEVTLEKTETPPTTTSTEEKKEE